MIAATAHRREGEGGDHEQRAAEVGRQARQPGPAAQVLPRDARVQAEPRQGPADLGAASGCVAIKKITRDHAGWGLYSPAGAHRARLVASFCRALPTLLPVAAATVSRIAAHGMPP